MSSAKGKCLALVRRCIEDEKKGLLHKYLGNAFERIVSEFYNRSGKTTMRSRPWALGKALAHSRGHSRESRGFVETPNAYWSISRDGQSPMSIAIRTKDGNYHCCPYFGYHVSARALADIDKALPEIVRYLREEEYQQQIQQMVKRIEIITQAALQESQQEEEHSPAPARP